MPIAILTAGGTIDKDYFDALSEYQIVDSPIDELLRSYHVNFDYEVISVLKKDSLEMTEADREMLRDTIKSLPHEYILITHGTDTMARTAQVIGNIKGKVIVITGAMRPARFKDTDAIFNIGFALGALRSLKEGIYLAMSGQIFDPWHVQKNRAQQRFESND